MSSIAIKTGTVPNAQSDCRAVMELCDRQRNCCQTTPNGQGLDNPGNDRESGQTDVYTNMAVLGNCAHAVREGFNKQARKPRSYASLKLRLTDKGKI